MKYSDLAPLRPFRLLVPPRCKSGYLYAYSALEADALCTASKVQSLPDHLDVLSLDRLQGKAMPDDWHTGQRLGFDVRVRPVRRLSNELEAPSGMIGKKGAEIDAFLVEALRRHPGEPNGMASEGRTREAVYLDWLAEQLAPAAALERSSSHLARFRRVRVARGRHSGPEGPDATIHGTLTVSDPDSFSALLARGVGRHRAYGYGMLLLRPPNTLPLER